MGLQRLRRVGAALHHLLGVERPGVLERERGQAAVRVALIAVCVFYLIAGRFVEGLPITPWDLVIYLGAPLYAGASFYFTQRAAEYSERRRFVANVGDSAFITYSLVLNGEWAIPLFVLYLWITLGNGFRFGARQMIMSTALSAAGFVLVLSLSPIWRSHWGASLSALIGLVVLPLYSASLFRQLEKARREAEQASAAKSRFLASMSHEMRTPFNSILGSVDLLLRQRHRSHDEQLLLETIQKSAELSLRQIENVLDFSKIEVGKLRLEHIGYDLHDVINGTMAVVRPLAQEARLRLMVRVAPATPYRLLGDPGRLREALLNLLSNAVKFTPHGYVSLEVRPVNGSADRRIRFEVHDTGIGIAAEALPRIFDAFAQEDSSTTRRYGGTGLGTAIAKQLVELMGGRIGAESIKDRGSLFWFELPVDEDTTHTTDSSWLEGRRVVLFGNDQSVIQHYSQLLARWGAQLVTSPQATDVVSHIGRGIRDGNPVLLVLTDHWRSDFAELSDRIIQSNTPLVVVSDRDYPEQQMRAAGYAARLPRQASTELLYRLLHSSPQRLQVVSSPVVRRVEPWAWQGKGGRRRKILVADDNRTNRLILTKILEASNCEVDVAEDGEQALDRLLTGGYRAAILDLHMPGLDGNQVVKQYRLLRPKSRTPIVILTANTALDAKIESAAAGADAFLTKPARREELFDVLNRLMDETEVHKLPSSLARPGDPDAEPVVNRAVLDEIDRIRRDPKAMREVIDIFEEEAVAALKRMGEAVARNDYYAFLDAGHNLKGLAANVGAVRLAGYCEVARSEQRSHGATWMQDQYAILQTAFMEALQVLKNMDHGLAQP